MFALSTTLFTHLSAYRILFGSCIAIKAQAIIIIIFMPMSHVVSLLHSTHSRIRPHKLELQTLGTEGRNLDKPSMKRMKQIVKVSSSDCRAWQFITLLCQLAPPEVHYSEGKVLPPTPPHSVPHHRSEIDLRPVDMQELSIIILLEPIDDPDQLLHGFLHAERCVRPAHVRPYPAGG